MKNSNKLKFFILFFILCFININIVTESPIENRVIVKTEYLQAQADIGLPKGQIGCVTENQEPGIECIDNNCDCPNDREGCVSVL